MRVLRRVDLLYSTFTLCTCIAFHSRLTDWFCFIPCVFDYSCLLSTIYLSIISYHLMFYSFSQVINIINILSIQMQYCRTNLFSSLAACKLILDMYADRTPFEFWQVGWCLQVPRCSTWIHRPRFGALGEYETDNPGASIIRKSDNCRRPVLSSSQRILRHR